MAQDTPNISEHINTVHEYIEGISLKLDGQDKYFALCSMFLLEIVQRELPHWRPCVTEDDERLMSLLSEPCEESEVIGLLCEMISNGEFDDRLNEVLPVLIKHVEAKVAITNPAYLQRNSQPS